MNLALTKKQEQSYDRTVQKIRNHLGSYHQIALRVFAISGKEHTGEGFRAWFAERRVPTHIVFALYELCPEIDPLTLCPWLAEHVTLKETPTCKA